MKTSSFSSYRYIIGLVTFQRYRYALYNTRFYPLTLALTTQENNVPYDHASSIGLSSDAYYNIYRSQSAAKQLYFIAYCYCTCSYTTRVVWQTKYELVMCISCVPHVFAFLRAHAKIECNGACTCQLLKFCTH